MTHATRRQHTRKGRPRRAVPVTDAVYAQLVDCRCPLAPGTHTRGVCQQSATRQGGGQR